MIKRNSKGQFMKGFIPATCFKKGRIPWNKGTKGIMKAWNKGKKCPKMTDDKNGNWKGTFIGKAAMHSWLKRRKGKASEYKCVDCGKPAQEWSNINNHIYRRILMDYVPRCISCHSKYDFKQLKKRNLKGQFISIPHI